MELLKKLPVFQDFEKIRELWENNHHLILKSPTGSGKSIALPYLLKSTGLVQGKILVAQPRRIAAKMLARQLAKLIHWEVGNQVGYQVRFDKNYHDKTQIIYATDGVVLNKLLNGDGLNDVEVLILDEFHERSAQIDLCLALALKSWEKKHKLRLVVTSATLDKDALKGYMPDSAFLELSGRTYPVQVEYKTVAQNYPVWKRVVEIIPVILKKTDGDILVFMDGIYEISRTVNSILSSAWSRGLEVRPLYGDLAPEIQDLALIRNEKRKIIVSTNIAETSLTIEGVKIVIDTGKAKKMRYDNIRRINALLSEPICRSSADQRAGRAGRLGPGFCLRLWSKSEHEARPEFDVPEITRIDLSEIYLNLAGRGIALQEINLLDSISVQSVRSAEERLKSLGAINDQKILTEHGKRMSRLSIDPRWSHALLVGLRNQMASAIALVLAILEGRSIVQTEALADFFPMRNPRSDIYCLLLAFEEGKRRNFAIEECVKLGLHAERCREAELLASELCNMIGVIYRLDIPNYENLAFTLLECFPEQIAYLVSDGRNIYQDYSGRSLHLSKHSVVRSEKYVMPLLMVEKKIKGRVVLEMAAVNGLDEDWIRESLGSKIQTVKEITWDSHSKKVLMRTTEAWGSLVFSVSESEEVSREVKAKAYSNAFIRGDFKLKNWNAQVEKFFNRQSFLSLNFPNLGITEMDTETKSLFLDQLFQKVATWKEIKNLEIYLPLLKCYSDEELALMDQAAPEVFDLGMGRRPYNLDYSSSKEVILRAVLQDLYDIKNHPTIVFGDYPLVIEILAPNQRPVQRTRNLTSFWEGSYSGIRKDLAGRYPKHEWR